MMLTRRSTYLLCLLLAGILPAYAQTNPPVEPATKGALIYGLSKKDQANVHEADTSRENKEPRYFYLTVTADAMVNTIGRFSKRFSPSVEFGRTFGIFDIGLAIGALNCLSQGQDTSHYIELRPTINIFSKGRFAEALCLGAGYVPQAKDGFMTEICNSINFNISENVAIAVLQGYYFFDGELSNRTAQYMGVNLTYNFLRDHSVNKKRKRDAIISDK